MNLTDRLEAEHRGALGAPEQLDRGCRAAPRGPEREAVREAVEPALRVVCGIVHGHAEAEEELVFPVLRGASMDVLLATLVAEHREVRALYETASARLAVWAVGRGPDDGDWIAVVRDLRGRLTIHMQRENLMVLPRARKLAPDVAEALENR